MVQKCFYICSAESGKEKKLGYKPLENTANKISTWKQPNYTNNFYKNISISSCSLLSSWRLKTSRTDNLNIFNMEDI
jgi:hypothetical protein